MLRYDNGTMKNVESFVIQVGNPVRMLLFFSPSICPSLLFAWELLFALDSLQLTEIFLSYDNGVGSCDVDIDGAVFVDDAEDDQQEGQAAI